MREIISRCGTERPLPLAGCNRGLVLSAGRVAQPLRQNLNDCGPESNMDVKWPCRIHDSVCARAACCGSHEPMRTEG